MAEHDVDIADVSDDEIVDLTGDDADWEDVEVRCCWCMRLSRHAVDTIPSTYC